MTIPENWLAPPPIQEPLNTVTLYCLPLFLFSPPFFQLLITFSPTFVHIPLLFFAPSYFSAYWLGFVQADDHNRLALHNILRSKGGFIRNYCF